MPWSTPTLREVRSLVRDNIHGSLPGSDATIPNSVLRVMSDVQGALCFLTLEYVDWLSLQLLPDTAENEWLDRHGDIWLVNADGTVGRKQATLAIGSFALTGIEGSIVPAGSELGATSLNAGYQITEQVVIGPGPTVAPATALFPGTDGNLDPESQVSFLIPPPGVDGGATVVTMDGGTEIETDDELRSRVLARIRQPPMGGDQSDYVVWATSIPGVTRAWANSEMGIGTITLRFMEDDLRADNDGWPYEEDVEMVQDVIDQKRPVTVKDCFVLAPIKQIIDVTIADLVPYNSSVLAEIELAIRDMLKVKAAPGQTIYASWISYAIMSSPDVVSFDLISNQDYVMLSIGNMASLGTIYASPPIGISVPPSP
jgi:uncharacterized phage protein gp47/JayE